MSFFGVQFSLNDDKFLGVDGVKFIYQSNQMNVGFNVDFKNTGQEKLYTRDKRGKCDNRKRINSPSLKELAYN